MSATQVEPAAALGVGTHEARQGDNCLAEWGYGSRYGGVHYRDRRGCDGHGSHDVFYVLGAQRHPERGRQHDSERLAPSHVRMAKQGWSTSVAAFPVSFL